MEHGSTSELELRDYLRVLKRRKRIVLLTVGVVVGAALLTSYVQEPVYAAHSRLLIQPNQSESPFDPDTGERVDARTLATNIEILKSELVRSEVRSRLGSAPRVAAAPVGDTDVVQVTAESSDPKRAAAVADAYVDAYINVRRQQTVDGLLAAAEQIQERVSTLQQQITALDDQLKAVPVPEEGDAARDSVNEQRVALVQQQGLFKETLDKLTVAAKLASGGAQKVGAAEVPTSPVKPKPLRNGLIAVAVGVMLGIGLAFLGEYLDDSIKTREDLERISGRVPVIGVIPTVGGWKERADVQLVAATDPNSPAAEAYRTLRTAIQFVALDRPMGVVQVTSSNAGEGKTTTMANLGVALAKAGQRVILVCCDLRRPRLHEFFGLSNEIGFTSMLLGEAPISRALQPVPDIPRLRLLASGPLPPNPSELLSSGRTREVFAALKADADIVLIDSPPVLPVTDALVLFRHVDATLMVFSAGSTTQKQAATALAMARQVDAPLVGTVLNGGPASGGYGSQYAYDYKAVPTKRADAGGNGRASTKGDTAGRNGLRNGPRDARRRSSGERPGDTPAKLPPDGS
jgi:polysaccharide biosynthesis transport protein